jgi:5-deoxy-D-glucuronate isomerase
MRGDLPNLHLSVVSPTEIRFNGDRESISYVLGATTGLLSVVSAQYVDCLGREFNIDVSLTSGISIGQGPTQRKVFHYLDKQHSPNQGLRSGLTVHAAPGQWSSLPHDFELVPEQGFEEIFYYGLDGGLRRAIQVSKGVLHDLTKIDDCEFVEDRTWAVIPMGFHPIVGLPDVSVSYLWAYIAKAPHWEKVK